MTQLYVEQWQDTSGTAYKECLQVVTAQWDQDPNLYYWINGAAATGYYDTGLNVSIVTKKANSVLFVIADGQGYWDTAAVGGLNISIFRGSTQIAGGSQDQWTGYANGMSQTGCSWSRMRTAYDTPNVPAGTTLNYRVSLGRWGNNTSRLSFGWPGYISCNKLVVMELEV